MLLNNIQSTEFTVFYSSQPRFNSCQKLNMALTGLSSLKFLRINRTAQTPFFAFHLTDIYINTNPTTFSVQHEPQPKAETDWWPNERQVGWV